MITIGIDIGTSYSSVCILDNNNQPERLKIATGTGMFGDAHSLPSAVFVESDGRVLLGQSAIANRMRIPENFKSEFKRDLGQPAPYLLGDRQFLPEDLYKEFFIYLKKCVEDYTHENVTEATITCPAVFNRSKKELIQSAAKKAGLLSITMLDEPSAAAYCYLNAGKLREDDTLLVYDLGGGTFDVALLRYTNGAFVQLTQPLGIACCGGADFDKLIYDHIMDQIGEERLSPVRANPAFFRKFATQIMETSIKAKHHLSSADVFSDVIPVGYDAVDYTLTQNAYNAMIAPIVDETVHQVRAILKNAGLQAKDVSTVLLVGGASRTPLVREILALEMGKEPLVDVDPELAVCAGAAVMERLKGVRIAEAEQTNESEPEEKNNGHIEELIAKGTAIINRNTKDGELNDDNGGEFLLQALKYYDAAAEMGNATACYLASQVLLSMGETEKAGEYGPQLAEACEPNSLCSMITYYLYCACEQDAVEFIRRYLNEESLLLKAGAVPKVFDTSASAYLYLGIRALSQLDAAKARQYLQKSAEHGNMIAGNLLELTSGVKLEQMAPDKILARVWSLFRGKPKFLFPSDSNFNQTAFGINAQYKQNGMPLLLYAPSTWGIAKNGFAVYPDGIGYKNAGSAPQFLDFADLDLHEVEIEETFVTLGPGRYIEINLQSILTDGLGDFTMTLIVTKLLSWFTKGLI